MKVGDYVESKAKNSLHGRIVGIDGRYVSVALTGGGTELFHSRYLRPKREPAPVLKLEAVEHLDADIEAARAEFLGRYQSGVLLNDLWQAGGSLRRFMGFCEFMKSVRIP